MSPRTSAARQRTLDLIQQAQDLLYQAAQCSCDLQGWCREWEAIGAHAEATKALWHKANNATPPTGHDADRTTKTLGLRLTR